MLTLKRTGRFTETHMARFAIITLHLFRSRLNIAIIEMGEIAEIFELSHNYVLGTWQSKTYY